jgi:poly(3-hydroxybutyrate) depolymerase
MATIVAAAYPDVFAALGVAAGVPYGAASDCLGAFNVMERIAARMRAPQAPAAWADYWKAWSACLWAGEFNPFLPPLATPDTLGERALAAMGEARRVVPVIVFQGSADETVRPQNGRDVVRQWAQTDDLAADGVDDDDIDAVPETGHYGSVTDGRDFLESSFQDERGNEVIRAYLIEGMAHAWPGGAPGMDYSDPAGPDASALLWGFFRDHPMTPDPPGR